uniref:Zinc finger protein 511 n=1 Tax=Anas platyrhynchos platyrhynchos TaxID=8840 RepID=U3J3D5_ANAPP
EKRKKNRSERLPEGPCVKLRPARNQRAVDPRPGASPKRRPRSLPAPLPPAPPCPVLTPRLRAAPAPAPQVSEFCCHISGCSQVFDTLEGYEHHYNTLHRNVCSFCKRSFPSGHLLDIHILEWHDSLFQIMAEKQNMYKCLVEGCTEKFKSSKDRKDHLVTIHLYPADFRFGRPKKVKRSHKCVLTDVSLSRVPSTICFGQGATRGFKGPRKKV